MSIGKQRNFVPRGMMIRALVPVYLGLIAGAPLAMAILPVVAAPSPSWRIATL